MKKVKTILETGVTTFHNQEGRIEVKNSENYDDRFDVESSDSIYKQDLFETLANIFKPV